MPRFNITYSVLVKSQLFHAYPSYSVEKPKREQEGTKRRFKSRASAKHCLWLLYYPCGCCTEEEVGVCLCVHIEIH